jgi:release factor glutamine methyltransferase
VTALTIALIRRRVAQAFREKGLDSPDLDARVLVGHAFGLDHAALASAAERILTAKEIEAISALAARRLAHEPVARIVGSKEFWGLELRITPATLVPRPETETVVEAALDAVDAAGPRERMLRVVDLGTGSGALLLALLSELPNAFGVGTDISLPALATARENAGRLGLASRARFVRCDFGAALRGPFDLVVSNPPYVASDDIAQLAPEVREHDPRLALDGGPQGLDSYRALAADARRILAPDGTLVVELGAGQASAVAALLLDGGIVAGPPQPDISGHPRALLGRLSHAWTASPGPKIALGLLSNSD